jgi:hypothetical protein
VLLIKIFTADNIVEVGLMRSLLEQYGIASELRNHHSSSLMGEVPFTSVWPELWVDDSKAGKAQQLISGLKRENLGGPDWACAHCNEANPVNFDICWQCGELNTG